MRRILAWLWYCGPIVLLAPVIAIGYVAAQAYAALWLWATRRLDAYEASR